MTDIAASKRAGTGPWSVAPWPAMQAAFAELATEHHASMVRTRHRYTIANRLLDDRVPVIGTGYDTMEIVWGMRALSRRGPC